MSGKHTSIEARIRRRIRWRQNRLGKYCGNASKHHPHGYRKVNYPTILHALKSAEELRVKGNRGKPQDNPLHIYYCEVCGGCHLGHLGNEESILWFDGEPIDVRAAQGLK